jgi:ferredoxin-nitrite reductase
MEEFRLVERGWETQEKLNKFELYKLQKDGLDILNDIDKFAEHGYDSIAEEDFDLLKWAGVYRQRPKDGHFMMRVKIPSGILNSRQARELAAIARDYGQELMDVTTRQAIQYHWLTPESLPDIFRRLNKVGLSSVEACGDCPRNVLGNPLAGVDPDELFDTTGIVEKVYQYFQGNRDYSNLPRKYKISISASKYNAAHAEINDLAFTPATKKIDGEEVKGFHVHVGGGLSAKPFLAKRLDMFVRPEETLKVAIAVTSIFRDFGYREKRHQARLKFLMADWGPEKFQEQLLKIIGPMPSSGTDLTLGWNAGYFYGVHKQKEEGLNFVGLNVPVGRTNADEFDELARLADSYGDGSIRTCNSQNIVLINIPDEKVDALLQEPLLQRLTPTPLSFTAYSISCTGNEFCNLAIVETKERMRSVAEYLDRHVQIDVPIRIHVNGCPNSCGQQQIADIGLQGSLVKIDGKMIDAFEISIGGNLGPNAQLNTKLKGRVVADDLGPTLQKFVEYYKAQRLESESFHSFIERIGVSQLQELLNSILNPVV